MAKSIPITGTFSVQNLASVRGGKVLFENLSFSLKPGEGLLITGPNGAGKTSLLRICAGFLAPSSGSLSWMGEEAQSGLDLLPGFAHYLGHATALKPSLTVSENLSFWSRPGEAELAAALDATGLPDFMGFPVKFLSEGQKKRVNLARFLIDPRPVWLMDEPAAGLDTEGQKILKNLIGDHLKKGGIFIGATHQDFGLSAVKSLIISGGQAS